MGFSHVSHSILFDKKPKKRDPFGSLIAFKNDFLIAIYLFMKTNHFSQSEITKTF